MTTFALNRREKGTSAWQKSPKIELNLIVKFTILASTALEIILRYLLQFWPKNNFLRHHLFKIPFFIHLRSFTSVFMSIRPLVTRNFSVKNLGDFKYHFWSFLLNNETQLKKLFPKNTIRTNSLIYYCYFLIWNFPRRNVHKIHEKKLNNISFLLYEMKKKSWDNFFNGVKKKILRYWQFLKLHEKAFF